MNSANLNLDTDITLIDFVQKLFSISVVFDKLVSFLNYEDLRYIYLCKNTQDNLKDYILKKMKINGLTPCLEKQYTAKIGYKNKLITLTSFNLEMFVKDISIRDFIHLFDFFLSKNFDTTLIFSEEWDSVSSYTGLHSMLRDNYYMLKKNNLSIPFVIQLCYSDYVHYQSFDFFYIIEGLYHSILKNDYLSKVFFINFLKKPKFLSIFKVFIRITTSPDYFGYVDSFFTSFKKFIKEIYQHKLIILNKIISNPLIKNEIDLNFENVFKMDFVNLSRLKMNHDCKVEFYNASYEDKFKKNEMVYREFYKNKKILFYQSWFSKKKAKHNIFKFFNSKNYYSFFKIKSFITSKNKRISYYVYKHRVKIKDSYYVKDEHVKEDKQNEVLKILYPKREYLKIKNHVGETFIINTSDSLYNKV